MLQAVLGAVQLFEQLGRADALRVLPRDPLQLKRNRKSGPRAQEVRATCTGSQEHMHRKSGSRAPEVRATCTGS